MPGERTTCRGADGVCLQKGFPATTERERKPEEQSETKTHRFYRETERRKHKKGEEGKMN